jgi:phage shock protein A
MSLIRRIFSVGKSEAHSLVDKLEDPVKLTEQGIRDLKKQLTEAMQGLAGIKTQRIRAKKDAEREASQASEYERKAMMLLKRAEDGDIELSDAERLASEAIGRQEEAAGRAGSAREELQKYEVMSSKMEGQVTTLRQQISKYENELRTLKARSQVSRATKKLNEQLSQIDSSSTISMLERMRDKVSEEEALAEAYGEMAAAPSSVDDEIDAALKTTGGSGDSDRLAALRAKMSAGKQ